VTAGYSLSRSLYRRAREALVLAYNDLLLLIGGLFVVGLTLIPLVRRPRSAFVADRH